MKKILALCLLSGLLIFNTACKEVQNTESGLSAEIWTAGGTEKFLRDYEYTERYENKVLQISACANEYEGAQIMLSGDVGTEYTVELSDLTDASGNTLSKEAFALYNQKYIEVNKIKNKNDYSAPALGYYPDAILPMETAIEYGENKLTGLNQGIWVSLKVPKEQKAGIYTGNFTVVVAGERKAVPVSVQIYDYTLTDETHVKNSFGVYADEIAWGEMDATVEMYEAYYEFFLNHRVSPQHLPGNDISGVVLEGERLELFLDYATKYAKDIRCSHYNIPYALTTVKIPDGDGGTKTIPSVDFVRFANTLTEMATRSMEESVNLLEKAGTYFLFFDEYDQSGTVDRANYNLSKAKETCEAVATLLQDTLEDNGNPALRN